MERKRPGPDEGPHRGPGFGIATAIAGALLFALLLAAPLLFLRIGESRERLDGLLRRSHGVRSAELQRRARVRGVIERQIDGAALAYDETLARIERGVDRMLPRSISEVTLPESLPLPRDVTPSVAPHGSVPEVEAAVLPEEASPDVAAAPDERAGRTAAVWAAQLAKELGLNAAQQQQAHNVMADYIVDVHARAARARSGDKNHVFQDVQARRTLAIESIQSILTAEQSARYDSLVEVAAGWRATGLVLTPLPGTVGPRR